MVDWISAAWVVWEVAFAVYTQIWLHPLTTPEWIMAASGILFAFAILFAEFRGRLAREKQTADESFEHAKEVAEAKLDRATSHANLSGKVELAAILQNAQFQELRGVTNTTDQSVVTTIEVATTKIAQLEGKLSRIEERSWVPLGSEEKAHLRSRLERHSGHRVQVVAHENPDCVELAHDIKECFRDARWHVRQVPITGSWSASGAHGLQVNGITETEALCREVQDALMDTMRGVTVGKLIDGRPPAPSEPDLPEVFIVVGTKKVLADD
jgi:hypothetical protein